MLYLSGGAKEIAAGADSEGEFYKVLLGWVMKAIDVIDARIDSLTAGLTPAVQRVGGAQFALMLSMISESQQLRQRLDYVEPDADLQAVTQRDDLYTPVMVGQMNEALHDKRLGDLHMWVSWADTVPLTGRLRPRIEADAVSEAGTVSAAQAAVLAGRYGMLDEITESRRLARV